jgi:DNA-binding SARP family transcriptional activator
VTADRLASALLGEDVSESAVKTVRVHVSRLRKALGDPGVLLTTPAGYRLRVRPGELDADRFDRLVAEGRAALAGGAPGHATEMLLEALALWRGPPLADVDQFPFAAGEIARLEDGRLTALELRLEADLRMGRHAELVGELRQLSAAYPLRERVHARRGPTQPLTTESRPGRVSSQQTKANSIRQFLISAASASS